MPQNEPLDISSFKFERAVFEFRHPNSYLLWDRAGALWQDANEKWPGLEGLQAEPGKTVFKSADRYLFTVELGKSHVAAYFPSASLEEFAEVAKTFTSLVSATLEIRLYARIGLRLLFFKEFPDAAAAAEAMLGIGILRQPQERVFGMDVGLKSGDFGLRWESKALGVVARVAQQNRDYEFDPPPEVRHIAEPKHVKIDGISFDIDFFTVSPMQVGQLGVIEWVAQCNHVMRRDSNKILRSS